MGSGFLDSWLRLRWVDRKSADSKSIQLFPDVSRSSRAGVNKPVMMIGLPVLPFDLFLPVGLLLWPLPFHGHHAVGPVDPSNQPAVFTPEIGRFQVPGALVVADLESMRPGKCPDLIGLYT